ncbi:hypothetical protein L1987_12994 [Smallanthus sonchifolius]|uniref:Uncharacterized protein n=1 Tax=Smallanthus sonchifolius TaxID=185202 RepID=A0ACB9JG53_9ASTR|nr:hypothetical protein L1987_12994 [Smallanthus sonchifolius]
MYSTLCPARKIYTTGKLSIPFVLPFRNYFSFHSSYYCSFLPYRRPISRSIPKSHQSPPNVSVRLTV